MGLWPFKNRKTKAHDAEVMAEHKSANKAAVVEAKTAADRVVKVFERNHFTVNIVAAMGAQQHRKEVRQNGR